MTMTRHDPILHREALRGGQMWSRVVRRGQALELLDVEGGASVAALFYNAREPLERYNMADTLKAQHTAFLSAGHVLYSDMGRVLMSIIEDTAGWHDTFTGHLDSAASERKFGRGSYQALRNDFYRDTRSNFLIELGKHGLGARDIVPNVNFFVKVTVALDGTLAFRPETRAGRAVTLRAELDTLVVLSNTPHPLDPARSYAPKPVELSLLAVEPAQKSDPCRTHCEQNERGFLLTENYHS
jgi:urea carboxylase-associated protein 2